MRLLITGGCGFIGAGVVRGALERGHNVLNIDRRRKSQPCAQLATIAGREGYVRLEADIADRTLMRAIFSEFAPERVIHLAAAAAEEADALFDAEIAGAHSVLEASRRHLARLSEERQNAFRIVHAVRAAPEGETPRLREAASATAASLFDQFARAQNLPTIACAADEVFGPWQSESGVLCGLLASLLSGRISRLDCGGEHARDWLLASDFCTGILIAAEKGSPYARYDFSAGAERRDLDIAAAAANFLDQRFALGSASWSDLIELSGDPGQARPAPLLDTLPAELELSWAPSGFHAGLERALVWAAQQTAPAPAKAPPLAAIAAE